MSHKVECLLVPRLGRSLAYLVLTVGLQISSSGVIDGRPGIMCATILYPASFDISNDSITSLYVCPLFTISYTFSCRLCTPISTRVTPYSNIQSTCSFLQ